MIIKGTRDTDYGISAEYFKKLYDENEGFNREASHNSRTIANLDDAMLKGGKMLLEEDPDLVEMLLLDKAASDD